MDLVLGNSSSGLIEVPSFNIPTVNVGNRQQGRLQAESVIQCHEDKESIVQAINLGLSADFNKKIALLQNPYGDGGASKEIVRIIKDTSLDNIVKKSFYDFKSAS